MPSSSHTTMNVKKQSWNKVNLNTDILNRLGRKTSGAQALMVQHNGFDHWAQFNRHTAGSSDGDLWVTWAWNYMTASAVAPRWWR